MVGMAVHWGLSSVRCNVWEKKNIQTALPSEMLFFKEKLGLQNFCLLYGGVAWQ